MRTRTTSQYPAIFTAHSVLLDKQVGSEKERFCSRHYDGFTLFEVVFAVFLVSVITVSGLALGRAWIAHVALESTAERMTADLRFVQESAISSGHAFSIRFSKYTTDYTLYSDATPIARVGFSPGVTYYDGYLQLNSGRVSYDATGDSPQSGVVRLVAGDGESDITLYMGTGLQSLHRLGGTK